MTKLYAVSVVLTKVRPDGSLDIANTLSLVSREDEEAARGCSVTEAMRKNPGFGVLLVSCATQDDAKSA